MTISLVKWMDKVEVIEKNKRKVINKMNNIFAIIEIGSNNTKTHVYKDENVIYENTTTIELKKNYKIENKISEADLNKLYKIIEKCFGIHKKHKYLWM